MRRATQADFGGNGMPANALHEMNELIGFVKPRLGEIKTPTLIMHSREDDAATLRNPAFLQKSLGGMVETVVLDDSYHVILIDRQRQIVADRTVQFANSIVDQLNLLSTMRVAAE